MIHRGICTCYALHSQGQAVENICSGMCCLVSCVLYAKGVWLADFLIDVYVIKKRTIIGVVLMDYVGAVILLSCSLLL